MTLNIIFETIATFTGVLLYKYIKSKPVRLIILLLTITVTNEIIIVPAVRANLPSKVNIPYNLFSLVDMICWFYFFYCLPFSKKIRNAIFFVSLCTLFLSFTELGINKWTDFHALTFSIYNMVIVIFSSLFLWKVLKADYYIIWSDSFIWLCFACIFYHSLLFISFNLFRVISDYNFNPVYGVLVSTLTAIANVFYYTLICTAFFVEYYKYKISHRK